MKLERLKPDPGALIDFYERGLGTLGALCERTWHDRLQVIADGRAAALWNPNGALHEVELHFAPSNATSARDAAREVFPGCPLTFRLAEQLRPAPLPLEKFILAEASAARAPDAAVAEKLWRSQFPDTTRWQKMSDFKPAFHYSLLALARCEIQAIDQHWSLHRMAVSLADGGLDDALAQEMGFAQTAGQSGADLDWPKPDFTRWSEILNQAFEKELAEELAAIRVRQENSLRRELERIDDYFENYERELNERAARGPAIAAKMKDRLSAAQAEHQRRRADQIAHHRIRVHPHLDALLLVAEGAWQAELHVNRAHRAEKVEALYVPRLREWKEMRAVD